MLTWGSSALWVTGMHSTLPGEIPATYEGQHGWLSSVPAPYSCCAQHQQTAQPVPAQASAASAAKHQTELAGSLTQLKAALSAKIQGLEADLDARGKHAEAVSKQALDLKSEVVTAQRAAEDARTNAAAAEERAKVSRGSAGFPWAG